MKKTLTTANKIAIFSDIHIGVHSDSALWHKISLQWCDWYVEELKKRNIKDIIFCGDFFHNRDSISVSSLQVGAQILNKLSDFNVYMIAGNHCCFFKDNASVNSLSVFKGRQNVVVVDEDILNLNIGDNCRAVLCPWGTEQSKIPNADVSFGHFEIQTFKMNTFKICDHGFSIRKLLESTPLVFSGHFHFRDERIFEIGKIIYVGNPFQSDLNDTENQKGFYIFDGDNKNAEFIENNTSPLIHRIKLSELCFEETDIKDLHLQVTKNVITFIIDEILEDKDIDFIKQKIMSFNPLKINFELEMPLSDLREKQNKFEGIEAEQAIVEFINLMDYSNKQQLQTYSVDLYRKFK